MARREDLHGRTFGFLTVIGYAGSSPSGKARWLCQCPCGKKKRVFASSLKRGATRSCGHIQRELATAAAYNQKHSLSYTPEYHAFMSAKSRCTNPNTPNFDLYGGRGIKFLFKSVEEWYEHLGPRPSSKHSVNRIDNDGHYEPGNVEWATPVTQGENRNTSVFYEIDGERKTLSQWLRFFRLGHRNNMPAERMKAGWCVSCAFKLPKRERCPHRS